MIGVFALEIRGGGGGMALPFMGLGEVNRVKRDRDFTVLSRGLVLLVG